MLSETLQELLSAYVDGELNPAEYERVMSALRDSALARDYVTVLRSMSKQLKELPTCQTPPQFTKQFLQERKREQLKKRNWRLGSVAAIAAGLLIGVSIWWYISQPAITNPIIPGNNELAKNTKETNKPETIFPDKVPEKRQLDLSAYAHLVQEALSSSYDQLEHWQDRVNNSIAWLTEAEAVREGTFQANQSTMLTGPVKLAGNPFKTLDAPLPLLQTPADFNLTSLQNRWSKKGLYVLDLSSKDTIKTLTRLIEAGKQAKVDLVIDDEIKQRLAKKLPTTFMLYLQNLSEDQASNYIKALSVTDYWTAQEARSDVSCQSLLLYVLDATAKPQVARSIGLAPEQFTKPDDKPAGLALSYYSYRLPTSLGEEARKLASTLHGPSADKLSFVVLIRTGK